MATGATDASIRCEYRFVLVQMGGRSKPLPYVVQFQTSRQTSIYNYKIK